MIDYNKRLVEVDEILKHLSEKDLLKIPEHIRQLIKDNKDKEYLWEYDETKELKDQNLNRDTVAFLSYLNIEYLLNEEQKKVMEEIHHFNEMKLEEQKKIHYNSSDLFKNREPSAEVKTETVSLIEYKENFFTKLLNKTRKIFRKM